MPPPTERLALGVALIVGAVFLMSIQDAVFKLYSADLSLWQLFAARGLMTLPIFLVLAWVVRAPIATWREALTTWPLIRGVFMTLQFMAFYAAIPFLNLSTVAAGIYTGPIFITLLSARALGEPVPTSGWVAIALGFVVEYCLNHAADICHMASGQVIWKNR